MNLRRSGAYPILLLLLSLDSVSAADSVSLKLKNQVTIYRDHYGTPHIVGETEQRHLFRLWLCASRRSSRSR